MNAADGSFKNIDHIGRMHILIHMVVNDEHGPFVAQTGTQLAFEVNFSLQFPFIQPCFDKFKAHPVSSRITRASHADCDLDFRIHIRMDLGIDSVKRVGFHPVDNAFIGGSNILSGTGLLNKNPGP
ncbi:hypothetical protein SDC9_38604 [bioreactor metagenome]|uniref:Uncharacterized protein n=1 Tax=bioreactor metagenome TaxID=1076179 RepID=A0A644VPY1_9ZZZZ